MVNAVDIKADGMAPAPPGTAADLKGWLDLYRLRNQVEGKSLKTTSCYHEMFKILTTYLETHLLRTGLLVFNVDVVRGYILYLQHKPRFQGHPWMPAQAVLLSPKTIKYQIRVPKAFSSWLQSKSYTPESQSKNLKLPKVPIKMIKPLTAVRSIIERLRSATGGIGILKLVNYHSNNAVFADIRVQYKSGITLPPDGTNRLVIGHIILKGFVVAQSQSPVKELEL